MNQQQAQIILDQVEALYPGITGAIAAGVFLFALCFVVPLYVYHSMSLQRIAKRLKLKHTWLSWIPLVNYSVFIRSAGFHWGLTFVLALVFLPLSDLLLKIISFGIGVFGIVCLYKICERRKFPAWTSLLVLIPFFGIFWFLVLIGILAWKDK